MASKKPSKVRPQKLVYEEEHAYNYGRFEVYSQEQYEKKELEKVQRSLGDWWSPPTKHLFCCELEAESTCCGFPVLGQFPTNVKIDQALIPEIAQRLNRWMKNGRDVLHKKGYCAAYLPDQKKYDGSRNILIAAGFKPQISLKSNHGKYTNTRWEWIDESKIAKQPHQESTNEKNLRTLPV